MITAIQCEAYLDVYAPECLSIAQQTNHKAQKARLIEMARGLAAACRGGVEEPSGDDDRRILTLHRGAMRWTECAPSNLGKF